MNTDDWRERAACRDHVLDFDATFDTRTSGVHAYKSARQVCQSCLVKRACLDDALASEQGVGARYGMRAGLLPSERSRLARQSA